MKLNRKIVGYVSMSVLSIGSGGAIAGSVEPCPDCVIEVHAIADAALFAQLGSGTEDYIRDVIEGMDAVWSMPTADGGMGVGVVLSEFTVYETSDPWAASTDANMLLPNVKDFVSVEYPIEADGRDVVLMFSGLDFDGGTTGLAYVGVLCRSFSVGVLESSPDNLAFAIVGANHQLGHIAGARHDGNDNSCQDGPYIMSGFGSPSITFSTCSVDYFAELVANPFPNIPACLAAPAQACPADLTGDGVLDFFDVSAFLQAFGSQDPIADFTGEGVFDFFDISVFLQAFAAGCP